MYSLCTAGARRSRAGKWLPPPLTFQSHGNASPCWFLMHTHNIEIPAFHIKKFLFPEVIITQTRVALNALFLLKAVQTSQSPSSWAGAVLALLSHGRPIPSHSPPAWCSTSFLPALGLPLTQLCALPPALVPPLLIPGHQSASQRTLLKHVAHRTMLWLRPPLSPC